MADPLEPAAETDSSAAPVETNVAAAEETPLATPRPKAAAKKVISKPKEPGIVDLIMENILLIGAALMAIIAGIVLMLRRKENEVEDDFDHFDPMDEDQLIDDGDDHEEEAELDVTVSEGPTETEVALVEEVGTTEAETDDVVGEADIYIAYGKFDQAEEMLSSHLDSNPGNTAARLKLMEVYTETNNLEQFDRQYRQVLNLDDETAAQRASELRASFADAPEFEAESFSESDTALDYSEDYSTPDDAGELSFESESEAEAELESEPELDLDETQDNAPAFELDLDETKENDDGSIEFDLGMDEAEETSAEDTSTEESLSETLSNEVDETLELDLDLETEVESTAIESEGAGDGQDSASDDLDLGEFETLGDLDIDDSDEFSLDLDLSEELSSIDDSLDLDLSEELSSVDDSDALELDLDLGGDAPDAESSEEDDDHLPDEAISLALETDLELGEESDDLNIDLDDGEFEAVDDLDLETLDSEMDDLDLDALDAEIDEMSSEAPASEEPVGEESIEAAVDALEIDLADDLDLSDDSTTEITLDLEETLDLSEQSDLGEGLDLSEDLSFAEGLDSADADEEELVLDLSDDSGLEDSSLEEVSSSLEEETDALETLDSDIEALEAEVFEGLPVAGDDDSSEDLSLELGSDEEEDFDTELDFLADADEVTTKLDLARAYIDMGDSDGAKDILSEVLEEGNDEQRKDAEDLISKI
jgi:pilus assembly protein FimV